jgi:hypothetical protein
MDSQIPTVLVVLALVAIGVTLFVKQDVLKNLLSGSMSGYTNPPNNTAAYSMSGALPNNTADPALLTKTAPNAGASDSSNAVSPFTNPMQAKPAAPRMEGFAAHAMKPKEKENFDNPSEVPFAAANAPSNCYPKNQLNPLELLPSDPNSKWAQVNPQGAGDIAGKNYLNAGALIGVNTVGQSLRNASWDLRSEPANPQVAVSPWFNSTIEPDINRRTLEIA